MPVMDKEVLAMEFDNQAFNAGIADSIFAVDKFKRSLDFSELDDNGLSQMSSGLDVIKNRFSIMGIVGMRTIENLTDGAIRLGKILINKLNAPLNQIISGGTTRAANIEQAKFQLKGLFGDTEEGAKKLTQAMEDADYAVSGTAYGLDSAAKAASQLSASGIEVGDSMKAALRGISGVAAMTNSTYDDIARLFATVAGNGRLMGEQLNSLGARGLNAAATMAKAMNITEYEFRDLVSKGKIHFAEFAKAMDDAFGEHAKDANSTFTGSLANINAALSRIGADFIAPLREDMIPVFNAIRISVDNLRKGLEPVVSEFTKASKIITGAINDIFIAFSGGSKESEIFANRVTEIQLAMQQLVFVFERVVGIAKNVSYAFSSAFNIVFDSIAVRPFIFSMVKEIEKFLSVIEVFTGNYKNIESLRNIFIGLFSAISIGITVIKSFGNAIGELLKYFFGFSGNLLELGGYFGLLINHLDEYLKRTQVIQNALMVLVKFIIEVSESIRNFIYEMGNTEGVQLFVKFIKDLIANITENFKIPGFSLFESILIKIIMLIDSLTLAVENLEEILTEVGKNLIDYLKNLVPILQNGVMDTLRKLWDAFYKVVKLFEKFTFKDVLAVEQMTGMVSGITIISRATLSAYRTFDTAVLNFKALMGYFYKWARVADNVKFTLIQLGVTFRDLSTTLKADTIKLAADAILKVAEAMFLLSLIDEADLVKSLTAVTTILFQLIGTFELLFKTATIAEVPNMYGAAFVLISLSSAVIMLTGALTVLSRIKPLNLVKSLAALFSILASMIIFFNDGMTGLPEGMLKMSAMLILFGIAIQTITGPIWILSLMPWDKLRNGLLAFATILTGFLLYSNYLGPASAKMFFVSMAMKQLAKAVTLMIVPITSLSYLSVGELMKSILALFSSVYLLGGMLAGMSVLGKKAILNMLILSGTLEVLAVAMTQMAVPLVQLSKIKWTSLIKSMGAVLGMIYGLGGMTSGLGLSFNKGMIATAGTLTLFAVAIRLIAPALETLSHLNLLGLAAAMYILIGTFAAFLAISMGLSEVLPVMDLFATIVFLLSASVFLLGTGLTFAGIGLVNISVGLLTLASVLPSVISGIYGSFETLMDAIITVAPAILSNFVLLIASYANPIIEAVGTVLVTINDYLLSTGLPMAIEGLNKFILKWLQIANQMVPDIIVEVGKYWAMGFTAFLGILAASIPELVAFIGNAIIAIVDELNRFFNDKSNVERLRNSIENFSTTLANLISEVLVPALVTGIKGALEGAIQTALNDGPIDWSRYDTKISFNTLVEKLFGNPNAGPGDTTGGGRSFGSAVADGISDSTDIISDALVSSGEKTMNVSEKIFNRFKEMAKIETGEAGTEINKSFIDSLFGSSNESVDAIKDFGTTIGNAISGGNGKGFLSNLKDITTGDASSILKEVNGLSGGLLGAQVDWQHMSEDEFSSYINRMTVMKNKLDSDLYKVEKIRVKDDSDPRGFKIKTMKTTYEKNEFGRITGMSQVEATEQEYQEYILSKYKAKNKEYVSEQKKTANLEVDTETDKNEKKLLSNNKYWAELLKIRQNGIDAAKYQDMDLADFEEDIFDQMKDTMKSYKETVEDNINSMKNANGLFAEVDWGFDPENPVTKEKLKKNLEDQITQLARFTNVVNSLNGRIDNAELRAQIQEMGVDSLEELEALNSMTEDELDHYEKLFAGKMEKAILAGQEKSKEAKASALSSVNDILGTSFTNMDDVEAMWNEQFSSLDSMIAANSENIGHNLTAGITTAMVDDAAKADIANTSQELAGSDGLIVNNVEKAADIKSPSGVMYDKIGTYMRLGITTAFTDENAETDYINTATRACQMIIGAFIGNALYLQELGATIDQYIADGMNNNLNVIESAIQNMGMLIAAAGNALAGGSSPSVTPVWNGSNIQNGIAAMDKAFGANRTASLAAAASTYDVNTNKTITINDGKTVGAIEKLDRDINALWSQFNNLQVVMDSRALVGQIVAPMNQALGTYARQEARTGGM